MKTVNMHDAKTNLSRLVEAALGGEPFVIARAGKPLVKVVALEPADLTGRRIGFLAGAKVPDDFDTMGEDQIETAFGGA
ncbi:type II toxin-antitoxin system Phd/YefM family antitoxin [Jannaschia pohangensis]|uniref:Antitoxin n=1 Tax=Jannaschia pohangensis TaxID=390807 RepID=A0A1I3UV93_9RHOB|nr:type II toxin-antitoxin system prevent-host-death family antitoxin [Jannaschia pohangensis]SFJ85787.1 prevent-host-death family protein [Jannaschia pohangensis]